MSTILRLPVWLYLLIRLALWNDGSRLKRPILYDPIKDLQDQLEELIGLRTALYDTGLSGWVRSHIQYRMNSVAAEVATLRNLNVAAAGFIPKSK
jgi:hypothetical protein